MVGVAVALTQEITVQFIRSFVTPLLKTTFARLKGEAGHVFYQDCLEAMVDSADIDDSNQMWEERLKPVEKCLEKTRESSNLLAAFCSHSHFLGQLKHLWALTTSLVGLLSSVPPGKRLALDSECNAFTKDETAVIDWLAQFENLWDLDQKTKKTRARKGEFVC